ncbi:hypothetical protein [Mucilaginibacter ginsenosidivorax]|uniref:Uncharacterized protein n=1 Tax=Mucilaginibacter ginsenosidivorax TaxID=862126 RepID=A0A5B8WAA6_9SPHI|nr:hypothetical protein [Mucilaginibacter ginsenosidivorax]QEC79896.1 hypothetical protein FSB76_29515 [Mucilaginibacter ginsenosidivorax]
MNNSTKKNWLKWATNIVGLVPGLTVIKTNIGVPPSFTKEIMGGMVEAVCALIILLIWLNKQKLKTYTNAFYTKQSIICTLLFLLATIGYLQIYKSCTIPKGIRSRPTVQPLWLSNELKQYLIQKNMSSLTEYHHGYGAQKTDEIIQEKAPNQLLLTVIIIYTNFVFLFVFLTCSFAFVWIKFEKLSPPD